MCFASYNLWHRQESGAGYKARLESRIKRHTCHCLYGRFVRRSSWTRSICWRKARPLPSWKAAEVRRRSPRLSCSTTPTTKYYFQYYTTLSNKLACDSHEPHLKLLRLARAIPEATPGLVLLALACDICARYHSKSTPLFAYWRPLYTRLHRSTSPMPPPPRAHLLTAHGMVVSAVVSLF